MLKDTYGRTIDYLRISVTDRCNLRCIYCMPESGINNRPQGDLLTFEEIAQIVKVAVDLGIDKVRLTGGEPLVRKDLVNLIYLLDRIEGIKDLSLTTNGIYLKEYAYLLKGAGLKRINISLDSLDTERYTRLTRFGRLEDVLEGIKEAFQVGFEPMKINVLLLEDISKDEIIKFLMLTLENQICVRFLEFMPVNSFYKMEEPISCDTVLKIASNSFEIEEENIFGSGPARVYKLKGALGSFGLISPMSNKFCSTCNRLRLTSDGFLKLCLHSDIMVNLRDPLRDGAGKKSLSALIERAVTLKPKEHQLDKRDVSKVYEFSMCQIGG